MPKLTLNDPSNFHNDASAAATIAANNDAIEAAFENTVSRDGTEPNQMTANFDMNSNRILNLPLPINGTEPVRLQELQAAIIGDFEGTVGTMALQDADDVLVTGGAIYNVELEANT